MRVRDVPVADPKWAYFLDLDGTLVSIAPSPSGIRIGRELRDTVARLHAATGGALALITGRTILTIDDLFPDLHLPVAGQHGLERRTRAGRLIRHAPPARRLDRARERLADAARRHPGLLLEDKGLSLALHYRQAPALAGYAHRLARAEAATLGPTFDLRAGKRVVEIAPAGRDKGKAIAAFMAERPFRGRRPVFLGDDVTDEFGFRTVNRLGGMSIKVGPGPTAARWRLPDVAAVRAWLRPGATLANGSP
jgi:trehalose 6-phosphate phosphatase